MRRGSRDRERVMAGLWLFGGLLTALTLTLPYDVEIDERARAVIAVLALLLGLALLVLPALPEWALHGILVVGAITISICTYIGVADVEGVMYLLTVGYAFAAFPLRAALPHLGIAMVAYAIVLAAANEEREMVAPVVAWVFVMGVAVMLGFAIALLVELRERERAAGRRDRRIAEALQRALLPERLPSQARAAVAARYLPAAREADVGGDFYDAIELPGGRIALAIGDVAGKGLPAAAVVGRARAAWRAYALEDADPASVLARVDTFLAVESSGAQMTTMLYALVDLPAGVVTWASAGHLPPLHVPAGAEPRYLSGRVGPPLGVVGGGPRMVGHAPLEPGDALLLYTDGLVERREEPIDVGLERLREALSGAPGDADAVVDRALSATPARLGDDAAALALWLAPAHIQVQ